MSAGRIVLLVFGIIFVVVSFLLVIGGAVALAVDSTFRDNEGFYMLQSIPVQVNSNAVITAPADIYLERGWYMSNDPITIRFEAKNEDSDHPIFIGLARSSDISGYLSGVSYDEVRGFSTRPYRLELIHHTGTNSPAFPTTQNFWIKSTTGTGTQRLQWDITSGSYSLVIMNPDSTSPIYAEASVGVRVPWQVRNIALGVLIGGLVLLIIGGMMIFFSIRGW
jgi:hypothetical protein